MHPESLKPTISNPAQFTDHFETRFLVTVKQYMGELQPAVIVEHEGRPSVGGLLGLNHLRYSKNVNHDFESANLLVIECRSSRIWNLVRSQILSYAFNHTWLSLLD